MHAQGMLDVNGPRANHNLGVLRFTTELEWIALIFPSSSACHVPTWDRASLLPWIGLGRGFRGPYTLSSILRNERSWLDRCPPLRVASIRSRPTMVPRCRGWFGTTGTRSVLFAFTLDSRHLSLPGPPPHALDPPYHTPSWGRIGMDGWGSRDSLSSLLSLSLFVVRSWDGMGSDPSVPSTCLPQDRGGERGGVVFPHHPRGSLPLELGRGVPV